MSERYQITIKAGEHTFHFKTKTRVGEFWNFSEEMKEHVDWEQMALQLDKRTKEVLELAAEDAAIVDDLKRQMEAGCIMPQIYVPLQVSHIFKKEEGDK